MANITDGMNASIIEAITNSGKAFFIFIFIFLFLFFSFFIVNVGAEHDLES